MKKFELKKLFKKQKIQFSNVEYLGTYCCLGNNELIDKSLEIKTLAEAEATIIKANAEMVKAKAEGRKVNFDFINGLAKTGSLVACTAIAVKGDLGGLIPVKTAFSIVQKML